MVSHSVTYHQKQMRIPPLTLAEAGTQFSDPKGMQGWVDLCYVKADRLGIEPATCKSQVQRPTAEPPRNKTDRHTQLTETATKVIRNKSFHDFSEVNTSGRTSERMCNVHLNRPALRRCVNISPPRMNSSPRYRFVVSYSQHSNN